MSNPKFIDLTNLFNKPVRVNIDSIASIEPDEFRGCTLTLKTFEEVNGLALSCYIQTKADYSYINSLIDQELLK